MATIEKAHRDGARYLNPEPTSVGGPSTILKVLWRFLTNREERTPKRQLGPFHTDARVYETAPASGLRVTWMGHSSTLLEIDGLRLLIDPVWDQRAAPYEWLGPKRFFPAPLPLEELPRLDAVLLSHDHYDHLGAFTVRRLAAMPALATTHWIVPMGVGGILREWGVAPDRITEMDWTDSTQLGALKITALPTRHFSGRSLFNRFHTLWASYVIAGPQHRVYYGADSGEWQGFAEIGRQYGPFDLTMLEIGASDPLWADIHMGPDGAARTFRSMGATGLLMPIHWGLFDLALHAWRQPIQRIFAIDGLNIFAPVPGAPTEVLKDTALRSDWWR